MNEIMQNFEAEGLPGFPRIIGVIDGTHIRIRAPTRQPDAYVNRKKFHSLNTQASAMFFSSSGFDKMYGLEKCVLILIYMCQMKTNI